MYLIDALYGAEQRDTAAAIRAAGERAVKLNKNFSGFSIDAEGEDGRVRVALRSTGHDRSAIVRRIVSPIRSIFHRAGVASQRIHLMEQRVVPNGRSLTLEQGRTPKNTFTDPTLRSMLADAARLED